MSEFTGDKDAFQRRIKRLYSVWKSASEDNVLSTADAIVIALGTDEDPYSKSTCFQAWLFGYELPDMVMVLCREKIIFLSSKKNIDFIRQFESDAKNSEDLLPQLKLLVREKSDKDKANFEEIIKELEESAEGKTIGVYTKDKSSGEFIDGWRQAIGSRFEKVDISAPMAVIMGPKDDDEMAIIKKACQTTTDLFNKFVKEELMDLIDKEKRVKHSKLATMIEEALQNKKYISGVDVSKLDMCYLPIIQSGGKYALKFSTESTDDLLHFGTIICMLGTRYKSYCSNIVRTILVGPTDQMQKNYDTLLKAFEAILDKLRPGEKLSDVYEAAVEAAKADDASLVDKMTKSVGFAMGIEFCESTLLISAKSDSRVEKGMVFNINIGFSDLENPDAKDSEGKKYALFVGDTVIVTDGPATILTPNVKKKTKQISIFLKKMKDNEPEVASSRGISLKRRISSIGEENDSLKSTKKKRAEISDEKDEKEAAEGSVEEDERISTVEAGVGDLISANTGNARHATSNPCFHVKQVVSGELVAEGAPASYKVGDPVQVRTGKKWVAGSITDSKQQMSFRVRYTKKGKQQDEWFDEESSRLRQAQDGAVKSLQEMIVEETRMDPSSVLEEISKKFREVLIHYLPPVWTHDENDIRNSTPDWLAKFSLNEFFLANDVMRMEVVRSLEAETHKKAVLLYEAERRSDDAEKRLYELRRNTAKCVLLLRPELDVQEENLEAILSKVIQEAVAQKEKE